MFQDIKIKDIKVSLGSLTKTLRKKHKLSQQALANELNVSRITIQNVEAGKNYTIDTLLKILQHFDLLHDLHKEITQSIEDSKDRKSLY